MRFLANRFFNEDEDFDEVFRPLWAIDHEEKQQWLKTDIQEKNGIYFMEIEMPGFEKKDINIALNNGYLTISANKTESKEESNEKKNYIRRERRMGSCSRSYYVGRIDEKTINASYDKGILTVTFPKESKQDSGKKQIEIK